MKKETGTIGKNLLKGILGAGITGAQGVKNGWNRSFDKEEVKNSWAELKEIAKKTAADAKVGYEKFKAEYNAADVSGKEGADKDGEK